MGSYTGSEQRWCCGAKDLRGFGASLRSDRFFTQASECREVKMLLRASKPFRNESVFVSSGCPVKCASSEQSCLRLSADYPRYCITLHVFQFTDDLKCRGQQGVNIPFSLKTGLTVVAGMHSSPRCFEWRMLHSDRSHAHALPCFGDRKSKAPWLAHSDPGKWGAPVERSFQTTDHVWPQIRFQRKVINGVPLETPFWVGLLGAAVLQFGMLLLGQDAT